MAWRNGSTLKNHSGSNDLYQDICFSRAGPSPPSILISLPTPPTMAAPLFPGFGKGGRYKSQPLEFLIFSLEHETPSFENRKGWGSDSVFCFQRTKEREKAWASPLIS